MHIYKNLPGIMLCVLAGMVSQCFAQEARIVMPAGQVNKPYSKSIKTVLNEDYSIAKPLTDWKLVGPAPVGFDLDRDTGVIFGTSTTAETHLFRVQALDRSVKGRPLPLKLLVSLQIEPAEKLPEKGETKKRNPPQPDKKAPENGDDDNGDRDESAGQLQVKHSGVVSEKDEKTFVSILAGDRVSRISVAAYEAGEDGTLTKSLGEIKPPQLSADQTDYSVQVPLAKKGVTRVTVKGLMRNDKVETSIDINKLEASDKKKDDKGGKKAPKAEGAKGEQAQQGEAQEGDETDDSTKETDKKIVIEQPETKSDILPTEGSIVAYVKVLEGSGIKKIRYRVTNGNNFYTKVVSVNPTDDKADKATIRVRVLEGTNVISVVDEDDQTNAEHQAEIEYICKADCSSSFNAAEFAGSQNARAVVGIEQAGASSASSETKPFIDFAFSTPFWFTGRCGKEPNDDAEEEKKAEYEFCMSHRPPRMAVWGNVRLGATPEQIAAIGVLPSNFANNLGDPRNTVELVQSFDFLVGLETRLFTANGKFLSLIPGLPQKTRFYVAGGGGAISSLNARRELAQIFLIPKENEPQRQDFINRFGTPPVSNPAKEFVGLIPVDRDRFLRQWYAGLRLKTFYCHNEECDEYENNFPSTVDVMFGQNEAVTGGSLFYLKPDPNDPTKNIKKRSFVLRIDAFYPFPLQRANFLYFYGTAMMKIGAGGVRISNPLFLDRASDEIQITDPKVYIPSSDLQKMFQPSRDYYKIGMGIDLIGLINRFTN